MKLLFFWYLFLPPIFLMPGSSLKYINFCLYLRACYDK